MCTSMVALFPGSTWESLGTRLHPWYMDLTGNTLSVCTWLLTQHVLDWIHTSHAHIRTCTCIYITVCHRHVYACAYTHTHTQTYNVALYMVLSSQGLDKHVLHTQNIHTIHVQNNTTYNFYIHTQSKCTLWFSQQYIHTDNKYICLRAIFNPSIIKSCVHRRASNTLHCGMCSDTIFRPSHKTHIIQNTKTTIVDREIFTLINVRAFNFATWPSGNN